MIKFLLGFVALIVVLLATYMFISKPNETPKTTTVTKVEKKDVSEKQIEVSEVQEEKTPKRVISVAKSPKVVSIESTNEMGNQEEIAKDITQEDIDNAGSDEEKLRMQLDMMYEKTLEMEPSKEVNEEELLNSIFSKKVPQN